MLLLQEAVKASTPEQTEEMVSFFSIILKGGWLMIPMAILAILAVYVFVEKLLTIKKAGKVDNEFMMNLKDHMFNGNIESAKDLCRNTNSPIARMVEKGVQKKDKSKEEINASIENVGKLEVYKLEKRLPFLATVSGAAPMIGFLGTVIGMIRAFFNMANAGNNIDPTVLAEGIYEALVTTAVGLLSGISAYIAYNYLVALVDKVVFTMENSTIEFIDSIPEKK
jgi:biopolymer transport protein ExbB